MKTKLIAALTVALTMTCLAARINPVTGMGEGTSWESFSDQIAKDDTKLARFVTGLQLDTLGIVPNSDVANWIVTPTSANLAAALTDELGDANGKVCFTLGTIAVASGKTATFNHTSTFTTTDAQTYTFPTTSATLARTDAANTFTGTQTIGALVATTVNGNTITTGTGTLTLGAGKTTTFDHTSTFTTTDAQTYTFPTTSATLARTDAANTFTGLQTMASAVFTTQALSGAGAVNVTTGVTKLTTTGASQALTLADGVDGQIKTIVHDVDGGSAILTPTTKTGFTTITFTAVGESATLVFVTTRGWIILALNGAVAG